MNWFGIRNPITKKDVEMVERELKIKLPEDYKEIIGPINGGLLKNACVVLDGKKIPYSCNISLDKTSKANVFQLIGEGIDGLVDGKNYFPFADVGNGDLFCFDLINNNIVLWSHETDDILFICITFTELINMIVEE